MFLYAPEQSRLVLPFTCEFDVRVNVINKIGKLDDILSFYEPEGVLSTKLFVDVPARPWKFDFLYTNFLHNYPPISISFLKEKHPILLKLGAFCHNLLKIHLIYVIWVPSSLMKTRRSQYQISRNCIPKGRHIYIYHHTMSMRTPLGFMTTNVSLTYLYHTHGRWGAEVKACFSKYSI